MIRRNLKFHLFYYRKKGEKGEKGDKGQWNYRFCFLS